MSRVREFNLALMGYDRRQVDAFADEIDAIVEQLRQQVAQLTEELDELRQAKPITADQAFANVGRETQQILQAAQQLRRLDETRTQLVRQLQGAAAEVERVAAGLETDTWTSTEVVRRASTGTDAARPRTSGAALRVVSSDEPTSSRQRRAEPAPTAPSVSELGGDLLADRRDQLASIRQTLIDHLTDGLYAARDQLRERVRQLSDSDDGVAVDTATFGPVAKVAAVQLRQAFDVGARAAARDPRCPAPATSSDDVSQPLTEILEELVTSPVQELLAVGRAADDPPWVLAERLDGVVSDAVEAMVGRIADTELSRAYERGRLATWTGGGVVARRWIVGPRGHPSDNACRSNATEGDVAVSEPFPSGEHTPPQQDRCNCTTTTTTTTTVADEENSP